MSRLQRYILLISILASFVAILDGTIVNVALPAIADEIGGGLATQQWVIDGYLITLGALMLLAGSLADLFGRQKILVFGLVGFAVTSLLCALAPSAPFLVASRILQGVAGAFIVPSSLALIISVFNGKAQGKAIGTWTAWTGISFVVGSLLGGIVVDITSWRFIFALNILPIAFTLWLLKKAAYKEQPQAAAIDVQGALLSIVGLGGPVYALIEQAHYGWQSPLIWGPLAAGVLAWAAFLRCEQRAKSPMVPLELFKVRNFSVGNIATFMIYAGLALSSFLITIFVQEIGGYSALQAGLAMLPVTIIMFLFSSRFGALAGAIGPRLFMGFGPLIAGVGFLSMLLVDSRVDYWTQLFPGILIFGLGLTVTVAPLTAAILGSIESAHAGIGSSINNAVARVAGLVAVAAIGLVTGAAITLHGFRRGLIVMAGLLFAGGIISFIGIQNRHKKVQSS